jgi:ammonia channel protein AmtB
MPCKVWTLENEVNKMFKIKNAIMGLRVKDEEEIEGLDISQHGEKALCLKGDEEYAD